MFIDRRQLAVFGAAFAAFTNLHPVQALTPALIQGFGAGPAAIGRVVAASLLAVALAAPLVGALSDLIGRKRMMSGSLALLAAVTLLAAQAGGMSELIAWRFLSGLFVAGIFTSLVAYIREEWSAAGAVQTTTLYISGTVLGGFSGRFLAGWATHWLDWRSAFVLLGLLDLLVLPMLLRWLPASRGFVRGEGLTAALANMRRHLGDPRLLTAYAIGFCMLFALVGAFTFVSLHLAQPPFALGTGAIGSVFAVYLLGVVVTPISGRMLGRFGRAPVCAGALLVGAGGLLLTLAGSLGLIVTGLALFSSSLFIVQATATGFVPQVARAGVSAAVGLYVSAYYVGGTVGAVVPGYVWAAYGWPGCVVLLLGVQALAAGLAFGLWRREAGAGIPR